MVNWNGVITHALYGGLCGWFHGAQFADYGPLGISMDILLCRSFIGIINSLTEEGNENVVKVYEFVDRISWYFVGPLYAAHLWQKHGLEGNLAYLIPVVAAVPYVLFMMDKQEEDLDAAVFLGTAVGAAYVTIVDKMWLGLGAAVLFAATHDVVKVEIDNENFTKEDLFNLLLSVYVILISVSLE